MTDQLDLDSHVGEVLLDEGRELRAHDGMVGVVVEGDGLGLAETCFRQARPSPDRGRRRAAQGRGRKRGCRIPRLGGQLHQPLHELVHDSFPVNGEEERLADALVREERVGDVEADVDDAPLGLEPDVLLVGLREDGADAGGDVDVVGVVRLADSLGVCELDHLDPIEVGALGVMPVGVGLQLVANGRGSRTSSCRAPCPGMFSPDWSSAYVDSFVTGNWAKKSLMFVSDVPNVNTIVRSSDRGHVRYERGEGQQLTAEAEAVLVGVGDRIDAKEDIGRRDGGAVVEDGVVLEPHGDGGEVLRHLIGVEQDERGGGRVLVADEGLEDEERDALGAGERAPFVRSRSPCTA